MMNRKLVVWKQVQLLASYCCNIPGGRDMSAVRHGASVKRACVRTTVTAEDIIRGEKADESSVTGIKKIQSIVLKIERNNAGSV